MNKRTLIISCIHICVILIWYSSLVQHNMCLYVDNIWHFNIFQFNDKLAECSGQAYVTINRSQGENNKDLHCFEKIEIVSVVLWKLLHIFGKNGVISLLFFLDLRYILYLLTNSNIVTFHCNIPRILWLKWLIYVTVTDYSWSHYVIDTKWEY